jgi:hypothetical protein
LFRNIVQTKQFGAGLENTHRVVQSGNNEEKKQETAISWISNIRHKEQQTLPCAKQSGIHAAEFEKLE